MSQGGKMDWYKILGILCMAVFIFVICFLKKRQKKHNDLYNPAEKRLHRYTFGKERETMAKSYYS